MVDELVSNINVVEKLQQFQYKDKNGRDWGLNVRQRAKEIAALVGNAERIRAERAKVGPWSIPAPMNSCASSNPYALLSLQLWQFYVSETVPV